MKEVQRRMPAPPILLDERQETMKEVQRRMPAPLIGKNVLLQAKKKREKNGSAYMFYLKVLPDSIKYQACT